METLFLEDSYANYIDTKLKTIKEDKEFISLMENMYKNPYVDKMTDIIQTIINENVEKTSLTKNGYKDFNLQNKRLVSLFKALEDSMNKAFNIKSTIRINNEYPNSIRFGACIFIQPEDFDEAMNNEIEKIIKEDKTGKSFVKINKCEVWIQEYLFKFVVKHGMNARHITAVLLHEIGHKLYLQLNTEIEEDHKVVKIVLNSIGISTSIIVTTISASLFLSLLHPVLGLVVLLLNAPIWITVGCSNSINNVNSYSETEGNCDYNAITFGYGKEIYELFVFFESQSNSKGYILTKNNFIRKLFSSDYKRREIMYNNILKEINNPNNTKVEREELKNTLKYIDDLIVKYSKKNRNK